MDFFAMKRKKLQSLCKKHGIPANLKNKDMAEKLSLIYKEEKNENPGSRRLQSDADKSNVEIIVLDSDSDSDVQMEDTVAEKDINVKTNVIAEHLLDEEQDQVLTSSPISEGKSDFNAPHTDDSGIAAGNADACEVKSPAPSDLNTCHIVDSVATHTDEVKSSDLNDLVSCPLRFDEDKSNLKITELNFDEDTDAQMEASDTVAEKDSNEKTDVRAGHLLDKEPDLNTSPLGEVKSRDLNDQYNVDSGTAAENADAYEVKIATPGDHNVHDMIDSGTAAGHIDACEVRSAERSDKVGSFYVEEDIQMSANILDGFGNYMMLRDFQTSSESTDVHEDTDVHQGSVDQVPKLGDYHCVISQAATTCLDASPCAKSTDDNTNVNVENTLDEVHSSSFGDSDGTPVQFLKTNPLSEVDTSDLDADKMVVTGTATKNACTSGAKFELSQKMCINPASKEIVGSSTKLQINSVSPRDVIFCNMEESVQIGVNRENIDPNEDVMHAEPNAMVMSHNEDLMLEDEVANVDDKFDLLESVPGSVNPGITNNTQLNSDIGIDVQMEASDTVAEKEFWEKTNVRAGHLLDKEPDQFPTTSPHIKGKSSDLNVPGSVNPGDRNSTQGSNIKTGLMNTYVTGGDLLDEVLSSSFAESAGSPVQFLPTDLLREAETSDLNVHKMFETGWSDMDDNNGANSDEEVKADELVPAVLQSSEMESCEFGLQELFAQDTASGDEDSNQKKLDSAEDENQAYHASQKRKRSDGDDINGANSNKEVKANELVLAEPQYSEMESSDFGLQQLFAQDTASSGDEDAIQKKLESPSKATAISSGEKSILFTPKFNESSMMHKEMEISMIEEENHREDCISAQREISKFFDTSNVHDDIGLDGPKDENQAYSMSRKRKMSDVDNISGANSDEELKTDELFPAAVQSSEMESCGFGLQQLFAKDTASSGDEDAIQKKLESPSKATAISSGEKSILFTPKFNESSMMHKEMEISMIEEENHREDCISAQREISKFFDTSNVHDDIGLDGPKDENQAYSTSRKRKMSDVDNISGANSDEELKTDELFPAAVQSSEMESCGFGLQQLFAKDTASSGDEDAIQKKLESPSKATAISSGEKSILFTPKFNESSMMHKEMEISMIEEENHREDCISAQREISKFFDTSNVHDDIGLDGPKDENQAYSTSRKRKMSDVDNISGANSDEELKTDELFPAAVQSSEMESCGFGLQQLFAKDTASSGDEDAIQKKLESPSKATAISSGEKSILFTPKFNESSMMHKEMEISMIEEENHREDCISAQREISKFFDTSNVHDDIGLDGPKDENQAYSTSRKRKMSDVDNISGANSDEELKTDELFPAAVQSSEMESCGFGLQQLFAKDTASSGDEDAIQKKLESPSKATAISSGEKSILFTPKFNESSMMHKEMEISMIEEENHREDCISAQREINKFFDTSNVHDDIGLDGPKDENQAYSTSRKRKMSDVDNISCANSDEELKTDELFPAAVQSSEMESCGFGLQQLFAKDTASEDEDTYQKKLDSSSAGTPIAASGEKSIIFTPRLHESSMMHKKMRIEMNLSQKPAARDSVGTFAMKENIKTDKEDISSTVSRNKFAKRLPLQDLHQN
ncbi:uncharacterized protein LOC131653056 [Vicia villosa]|uniref:uncharacterized protein LOC131653056 n=1 Tax=Vicia villosa TaxID=3911 RepID=UPI00273AA687|nr:uncharacterized protein LOC131653056 [Vicia villosa]